MRFNSLQFACIGNRIVVIPETLKSDVYRRTTSAGWFTANWFSNDVNSVELAPSIESKLDKQCSSALLNLEEKEKFVADTNWIVKVRILMRSGLNANSGTYIAFRVAGVCSSLGRKLTKLSGGSLIAVMGSERKINGESHATFSFVVFTLITTFHCPSSRTGFKWHQPSRCTGARAKNWFSGRFSL